MAAALAAFGNVCMERKKEGPRRTADLDCLDADNPSKRKSYSTFASAALSPTMSAPRSLPSAALFL